MFRKVRRKCLAGESKYQIEDLVQMPPMLTYSVGKMTPCVSVGETVTQGQELATSKHSAIHAAAAGTVERVDEQIAIRCPDEAPPPAKGSPPGNPEDLPAFLAKIGLEGMGGARFPASIKVRSSVGAGTLVVNAVECEPCVNIDRAVLLNEVDLVRQGAQASAAAIGADRTIIAIGSDKGLRDEVAQLYGFQVAMVGKGYPSGAERLILQKLTGKMPPAGVLPYELGYLVQNVVSLRTLGKALQTGVPVIERPLTLVHGSFHRNIRVPIGMRIGDLLNAYGLVPKDDEIIVKSGLMMGIHASGDDMIDKGTTSIFVVSRKQLRGKERACINCGSCYDVCPLNLHPVDMVQRLQDGHMSKALRIHLETCFLCGTCDAVCPSNLPLAQDLRTGKEKLK